MASPSALLQQSCILCWTIRNADDYTACIYSALTLYTERALCHHFNLLAKMIISWKSALLVKSKVSECFMVCLPLWHYSEAAWLLFQGKKLGICFKWWCKEQLCTCDNSLLSKDQEIILAADVQRQIKNSNVPGCISFPQKHLQCTQVFKENGGCAHGQSLTFKIFPTLLL